MIILALSGLLGILSFSREILDLVNGVSHALEGIWYLSFSFQKFQQKAIKIESAKVGGIKCFWQKAFETPQLLVKFAIADDITVS